MTESLVFGRVHPERLSFRLGLRKISVDSIPATLVIHDSQILLRAQRPDDIDPWTFRNVLRKGIKSQVDLYGFLEGRAYDVEITGIVDPNGEMTVFDWEIPRLTQDEESLREEYEEKILSLFATGNAEYLRHTFHDFNFAMRYPNDTGFACYRAIESIRKHIQKIHDIPDDGNHDREAWKKMHEELGTSKEEVIEIAHQFANERRHGGITSVSDSERKEIFLTTQDAICRYIDYHYERVIEDAD